MDSSSGVKSARRLGRLAVNILSGPLLRVAGAAIVMAAYPAYLRWLGAERYGLWLALSTVLMLSQFGGAGIGEALAKVVAEEHARGSAFAIRQYATTAAAALSAAGAASCLAVSLLRDPITRALGLSPGDAGLARELLPYCGAVSVYALLADAQASVLAGLGRIDLMNALQVLAQSVAAAAGVALLRCGYGIHGLLAAALISRVAQHAAAMAVTSRMLHAPAYCLSPIPRERLRRFASLSAGLFGGAAVGLLLNPLNRLLVARFAGVQAAPVYEIAYNGAMQIRALLAAGVRALLPEVSRLSAGGAPAKRRAIGSLTRRAALLVAAAGAPIYAAAFAAGGPLLRRWLGGSLPAGQEDAFRIILAGSFVSLLGTVPYYSLLGLHRGREVLYGYVAQSAVNLAGISALWGCSTVQLTGILWATSAGMTASTLYLVWAHRRALAALSPKPLPATHAVPGVPADSRSTA